jgi:hypothetical protein
MWRWFVAWGSSFQKWFISGWRESIKTGSSTARTIAMHDLCRVPGGVSHGQNSGDFPGEPKVASARARPILYLKYKCPFGRLYFKYKSLVSSADAGS